MKHAEIAALMKREPEKTFKEMMVAIGDTLSDHASSDHRDDGEDEHDAETEQGKLSEDDEPGWVIGTLTKTVQQCMGRFRQKQMKLAELTQPGWEDASNNFREGEKPHGTSELRFLAVIEPQTDDDAAAPAPTSFGELMECVGIVSGISHMPRGTSPPGSSDFAGRETSPPP